MGRYDDALAKEKKARTRKKDMYVQPEHELQVACVTWFMYEYPELQGLLFAVPNGGRRDAVTGAKMKAEGVVAGVSDLILLVARGDYHGLLIEMKTIVGRQSSEQKTWEKNVTSQGYLYTVCRTLEEFIETIENYINNNEKKDE